MLLSLTDNAHLYILGIEGGKLLRDYVKTAGNYMFSKIQSGYQIFYMH